MKKYSILLCGVSLISIISAFEDKPALTRMEKTALIAGRAVGSVAGAGVGSNVGARTGFAIGTHYGKKMGRKVGHEEGSKGGGVVGGILGAEVGEAHGFVYGGAGGLIAGGITGIAPGAFIGYKTVKPAITYALAKYHGVSYRTELVSQYYNVNIAQYRPILTASEKGDSEMLIEAIKHIFPQRFGDEWEKRLLRLFKKYGNRSSRLIEKSSFSEEAGLKDYLRFVELGAAMSNLYFETNPNLKQRFSLAKKLYQALGFLK